MRLFYFNLVNVYTGIPLLIQLVESLIHCQLNQEFLGTLYGVLSSNYFNNNMTLMCTATQLELAICWHVNWKKTGGT